MNNKPVSILKFHGARGSRPVHSTTTQAYGGNTTCLEIDAGHDFFLVIDSGTGLSHLQKSLQRSPNRKKIHFLITHTHWDHIASLPFLPQFSDPDFEISIHAPDVGDMPFSQLFNLLVKHSRLPILWTAPRCKLNFFRIRPGETFLIESKVKVSTFQVNHQHITLAYKIGLADSSVAIVTDTALLNPQNILGQGMASKASKIGMDNFVREYEENLINFLKGVDSVVFDTHFNEQNLRIDWGHCTPQLALHYCAKAGVKKLFMFHHAPEDDDHAVALKQDLTRHHQVALQHQIEVINAREEDEWLIRSA
jgi:ribonuclease BN (tRNA processing enzyme)